MDSARSRVFFEGSGPFQLPTALRTEATAQPGSVVMATVYCLASMRVRGAEVSRGKEPEPIGIPMSPAVARELARALLRAADLAER